MGVKLNISDDLPQIAFPIFHLTRGMVDSRVIELGIFYGLECDSVVRFVVRTLSNIYPLSQTNGVKCSNNTSIHPNLPLAIETSQ